ncbi:glycosyl hydrolase family 76 protein [Paecilomyces variotii No. 5]|uniref:Mannan endo-1,6-alpha-mannosidase n=1 Tax=Byssochlamys spectabilis (strain No. 5 / NBRC 109023) TaxID=1356009 RepID=V5F757_BYSSN|nr:glycosyl hydrolase family 76 protein [Paecilomyces variotii No. 5]
MRLPSHIFSETWSWKPLACAVLLGGRMVHAAIDLDLDNPESIKNAAKTAAAGMMKYYTGDQPGDVPGNLPDPYYWWEAGAMFGALIDYHYYTGDKQYVDVTTQAMLWQVGPEANYMPPNQSKTLGNDDQGFWGMAAMTAAETKFPNPPEDKPQWLALAQAVFNTQAPRWDNQTCGGGLKWQIFTFNNGYNYKNTISNGCFFNLAARLAVYTGNETYAEWAERAFDWVMAIGLGTSDYTFFDGTDDTQNCTSMNHIQWSYNSGVFMMGAAAMYNFTDGSERWKTRLEGIIRGANLFFENDIMTEVACENNGKCNVDQRSFKAYLTRWMAATIKLAPFTHDLLMPKLQASAIAAAQQCSGPDNACGLRWTMMGQFDGSLGVGEQMSAMEIFQSNLIDLAAGPVTNTTGGTSKGDYSAGTGVSDEDSLHEYTNRITVADRAGAGVLTGLVVILTMGGAYWMISS